MPFDVRQLTFSKRPHLNVPLALVEVCLYLQTASPNIHVNTHTHPFNGPVSRTTRVSRLCPWTPRGGGGIPVAGVGPTNACQTDDQLILAAGI